MVCDHDHATGLVRGYAARATPARAPQSGPAPCSPRTASDRPR
ncbi:hypothetical protein ACFWX8_23760 [Streptomyces violascens]